MKKQSDAFQLFSLLHLIQQLLFLIYFDFSKNKSPEKLHKILLDYGYQTTEYALHYASLNSELRKAERKKWSETKAKSLFDDRLKQIKQTEALDKYKFSDYGLGEVSNKDKMKPREMKIDTSIFD